MKERMKDWLVSNNSYRKEFDRKYRAAWKDKSVGVCSDKETPVSYKIDYIQFMLMVLGLLFVIIGSILIQIFDKGKVAFTIIALIGMLLLFAEYLVLHNNLRKTKYYEQEMLAVEEAFNRMVFGYKGMRRADKLAQIEIFALKYRKSPAARLSQFIWALVSIFTQILVVSVGIIGDCIHWNDISMGSLLIWIALMVGLNYLTVYFASGKAYNPGNYKLVTVKYRKWLLNK